MSTSPDDLASVSQAQDARIYPREVHGAFASARVAFVLGTLELYYLLPWINWGQDRQAFLIDLPGRKFHLFPLTFYPQDLIYLAAILILAALALFLFTTVAGRVWCGYACPQTVWTEVFLWMERQIEGDRSARMKRDDAAWTAEKWLRKSAKHLAWGGFALWTGFTFVGYFTPIRELGVSLVQLAAGPWELFWIGLYALATYGNAGFLREKVCLYMCPYARFQSVMFDADTLVISYDPVRGEPRGARKRGTAPRSQGPGDCIDCTLCVQVCPTGIDIRQGLQYQCIGCAACVDACNGVMDKMGSPRGLIRYTTENQLAGGRSRIVRPRVLGYGAVLVGTAAALLASVWLRTPLALDVLRDRGSLYREMPDGAIENVYRLRLLNMDDRAHAYDFTVSGVAGARLILPDEQAVLAPGERRERVARLTVDPAALHDSGVVRGADIKITATAVDDARIRMTKETRFLAPR